MTLKIGRLDLALTATISMEIQDLLYGTSLFAISSREFLTEADASASRAGKHELKKL